MAKSPLRRRALIAAATLFVVAVLLVFGRPALLWIGAWFSDRPSREPPAAGTADRPLFAFVMLFNQARTPEDDERMQTLTQELIDAAHACGGRYYLPYRLHATPEQFHRAYPQAAEFFARKRQYDPDEIF